MIRDRVAAELIDLSNRMQPITFGTEWYLFGSVDRNEPDASDIDLIIICKNDSQADDLRRQIDTDAFSPSLDLSIFTYEEALFSRVLTLQRASLIAKI